MWSIGLRTCPVRWPLQTSAWSNEVQFIQLQHGHYWEGGVQVRCSTGTINACTGAAFAGFNISLSIILAPSTFTQCFDTACESVERASYLAVKHGTTTLSCRCSCMDWKSVISVSPIMLYGSVRRDSYIVVDEMCRVAGELKETGQRLLTARMRTPLHCVNKHTGP